MSVQYHISPAENVRSILREGLKPMYGQNSQLLGEGKPAIFLFDKLFQARNALENWGADAPGWENKQLAIFVVTGMPDVCRPGSFEHIHYAPIPPEKIELLTLDADRFDFPSVPI